MFNASISEDSAVATLSLFVDEPNESGALSIEGDESLVLKLRQHLSGTYGAFGHLFDIGNTTAIDLHAALAQSPFTSEILEGAEMIAEYDPQIPEDAVT